jgi:hypothetical protein
MTDSPQVLEVCAHQLWTGDMIDEGNAVITLTWDGKGGTRGVIAGWVVRLDGEAGFGISDDRARREWAFCERLRVVRGMPTPTGDHITQYDIFGTCHGHRFPPGSPRPCTCEWHR